MAECLIPERVPPDYVQAVYVANHQAAERLLRTLQPGNTPVIPEPKFFFQPNYSSRVGTRISLIEGDMFFSQMQTLTISVNIQAIMGKGLASRAKYQFPDVYVVYQDACRARRLTPTRPYLYKREKPLDEELADLSTPLDAPNAVKWFLLFATKRKWREDSRIEDIEAGLDWIAKNHAKEGIASLALPALGCGLGGLEWADVGPLMCRALDRLPIESAIYLPRERQIDGKLLTTEYLLDPKRR
jgi:O-acetyl-ADP-ribose deacetylase (regulator of RNase III)